MKCPYCQSDMYLSGGLFYERGDWDGASYEEEGSASTYKCSRCEAEIAIVSEGNKKHES